MRQSASAIFKRPGFVHKDSAVELPLLVAILCINHQYAYDTMLAVNNHRRQRFRFYYTCEFQEWPTYVQLIHGGGSYDP